MSLVSGPRVLSVRFLFVLFYLIGCASTMVDQGFYEPNHPKYSIELGKDGRKNGKETWWYANGTMKYQAVNKSGIRDGLFSAWYSDGKKWYEGFEYHGKPESTLTYWYPNGHVKSEALFRSGIQLERKDYDEDGALIVSKQQTEREILPAPGVEEDGLAESVRLRKAGLQIWALRVRQAVESYWVLPKEFQKERPFRAVAKIKVDREGRIVGVTWMEKSPSAAFNSLAQQTFKRIKRLPAFPPQVKDPTLEVQYEFISLGKQAPRRKLEAREPSDAPATE